MITQFHRRSESLPIGNLNFSHDTCAITGVNQAALLVRPMFCRHADGPDAAAAVAQQLEAGPAPGIQYWLVKLQLLCEHHCSARMPSAQHVQKGGACDSIRAYGSQERQSSGEPAASFERAVAAHGQTGAELWLLWLRHLRQQGQPTALLIQRAIAALPGDLADVFVAAAQSSGK